MTTAGKHLSSQTKSRFSQPHTQLWALLLLDVNGCDCVVQYMYVHVCAHVGQKEWNLALQCLGDYRDMPAFRALTKDNDVYPCPL